MINEIFSNVFNYATQSVVNGVVSVSGIWLSSWLAITLGKQAIDNVAKNTESFAFKILSRTPFLKTRIFKVVSVQIIKWVELELSGKPGAEKRVAAQKALKTIFPFIRDIDSIELVEYGVSKLNMFLRVVQDQIEE